MKMMTLTASIRGVAGSSCSNAAAMSTVRTDAVMRGRRRAEVPAATKATSPKALNKIGAVSENRKASVDGVSPCRS